MEVGSFAVGLGLDSSEEERCVLLWLVRNAGEVPLSVCLGAGLSVCAGVWLLLLQVEVEKEKR